MHIVYDHQIFSWQQYGGISRYFYELSSRMAIHDECIVTVMSPMHVNAYFRVDHNNIMMGRYFPRIPRTGGLVTFLNSCIVSTILRKHSPDIIHETYYAAKKLHRGRARTVVTVYDMTHEKLKGSFRPTDRTSRNKALAVKRADHVICISENTKRDLLEILTPEPSKVSVIYPGYSNSMMSPLSIRRLVQEPYILYVGVRRSYKNFSKLLYAYAASTRLRNDFRLVCLGGGGFSNGELRQIEDLDLGLHKVLQLDGSDAVSANLYRYASVMVYPSLYEGFGMPPLEAMFWRCPIACSATSSLPEVVGNAAEYFDPYDTASIHSAIETVVYSQERSERLISLGEERVAHFSWERCVEETKDVYASLL
jgi:glycosyltransferase involved in cell wall biosynthesis